MAIGRVSTYQFNTSFAKQVHNTQSKFNKLSQQITSGKRVTSVTDDAVAAKGIIKANAQLADIETYMKNLQLADNELTQTDNTLGAINEKLQDAYDLAMTVANGTSGEEQMNAYRQQLDAIINNITRMANTQYDGKYIFAGTNTTTEPYSLVETDDATADNAGLVYAGNDGGRYTLVGQAKNELPDVISDEKKEQINFIGKEVFGQVKFTTDADGKVTIDDANSSGAFKALYELKAALQNDPVDEDAVRATLDSLDESMSQVSAARTKTGALGKEFEDIQNTYTNDTISLKQLRSDLEDTDLPSAVSDWYSTYQSLQASYQMFSQTMDVSLLNYI